MITEGRMIIKDWNISGGINYVLTGAPVFQGNPIQLSWFQFENGNSEASVFTLRVLVEEIEEEWQNEVQTKRRQVRAMVMKKQLKKKKIEKEKQEESTRITLWLL